VSPVRVVLGGGIGVMLAGALFLPLSRRRSAPALA
jgi:hypothetical protein